MSVLVKNISRKRVSLAGPTWDQLDTLLTTLTALLETTTVTVTLSTGVSFSSTRITVTAKDADGATVAGVHNFELHMSESSSGLGLTGDTYSGDLTASTGKIIGTLTSKKAWVIQTHTTGVFAGDLVDSAMPADQYAVVKKPIGVGVVVSNISGLNWNAP